MSDTQNESCCCGGAPADPSERTPMQELQFLRDLAIAVNLNVGVMAEEELKAGHDLQTAVRNIRQQLLMLFQGVVEFHDSNKAGERVYNNPQTCYSLYYACLAQGGTNCAQQLQLCLSNPKSKQSAE